MKTIRSVKANSFAKMASLCLFNFGLRSRIEKKKEKKNKKQKHFKNQTIELVRALPQDPKVLCDFTWLVSILFSYTDADCRSFMFLHTLM